MERKRFREIPLSKKDHAHIDKIACVVRKGMLAIFIILILILIKTFLF